MRLDNGLYKCAKCEFEGNIDQFTKDKRGWTGYCKSCSAAISRAYRKNHPDKIHITNQKQYYENDGQIKSRKRELLKKYGMTYEEYQALGVAQNNKCKICNQPSNDGILRVDHNHTTGKVRGLLCDTCNRAIGLLKDDPTVLEKAAQYIRDNA
jgi:Autographiviridae endonuclease VII